MRATQLIGLLLWRGGLLLIGATLLVEGTRWLMRWVELPVQLEIGLGLALAGIVLVVASLILERARDSRAEGNLRE